MKTTIETYTKNVSFTLLEDLGVTFSAVFKTHGKHFHDDIEKRDIYRCSFKRGKSSFTVTFGQSIANTGSTPSAYDVLACLQKSDPGDILEFCDNFGYNPDSRTVEKIYRAVCAEWSKVNAFFTNEEIERIQEIQ